MRRELRNIAPNELYAHPENPRKDLGDLTELTESIKKNGLMQNLTVIPGHYEADGTFVKEEGYTILIGHRRCAAAKQAGIPALLCTVITEPVSKAEQIGIMLEENLQRNDLTVVEQAQSFHQLTLLGMSEEDIATKTGFSKKTIHSRLEIAKLDASILEKKSGESAFQLTLSDLAKLSKIESVEKRNQILDGCSKSSDIAWKVETALSQMAFDEWKAALKEKLEDAGIFEASEEQKNNRWYKDRVKELHKFEKMSDYSDVDFDSLVQPTAGYYEIYDGIGVLISVEQKEKQKTKSQLLKEKKEEIRKKSNEEYSSMRNQMKEMILAMMDGSVPTKNLVDKVGDIWAIIADAELQAYSPCSSYWMFAGFPTSPEDKEAKRREYKNLTMPMQMLVRSFNALPSCMYDYQGKMSEGINRAAALAELLEKYGFGFETEEQYKLLESDPLAELTEEQTEQTA